MGRLVSALALAVFLPGKGVSILLSVSVFLLISVKDRRDSKERWTERRSPGAAHTLRLEVARMGSEQTVLIKSAFRNASQQQFKYYPTVQNISNEIIFPSTKFERKSQYRKI